jgi:hypothetical protein
MKTLPVATFVLLLTTGIASPSRIGAVAPFDPAAEQIALIRIQPCEGFVGATEGGNPPLCSDFILTDTDGTHVIPIPGGEHPAWSPDGTQLLVVRSNSCSNCAGANGDIFVTAVTSTIRRFLHVRGRKTFRMRLHPWLFLEEESQKFKRRLV